jgi:hypothetical protein
MEEKWMRDPLSAVLFGLVIIGIGIYVVLTATLDDLSLDTWWGVLIPIGLALVLELPIRILKDSRYRVHGLIFTRTLIGGGIVSVGAGGLVGFDLTWFAISAIALGCAILLFGIWWWQKPKR